MHKPGIRILIKKITKFAKVLLRGRGLENLMHPNEISEPRLKLVNRWQQLLKWNTCAVAAHVEYLCNSWSSGMLVQHLLMWITYVCSTVAAQVEYLYSICSCGLLTYAIAAQVECLCSICSCGLLTYAVAAQVEYLYSICSCGLLTVRMQ